MLYEFFKFEIKYKLKFISTYIYGIILFGLGFLIMNIFGGAFRNASVVIMGSGGERIMLNSSGFLVQITGQIFVFFVFIAAALMSDILGRDLEYNTYPFYFTKPINKWAYITGRFTANFTLLTIYSLLLFLGKFITYYMPWIEKESFMTPVLAHYLSPLLVFVVPNFLLLGSIMLGILLLTKKTIYLYVSCFVIIVVYLIGRTFISDIGNRITASLIDPFGLAAFSEVTRLWSVSDLNTSIVKPTGLLFLNRILWVGLSLLILLLSSFRFSLSWLLAENRKKKVRKKSFTSKLRPRQLNLKFGFYQGLKQFFSIVGLNSKLIFKSFPFYLLTLLGIGVIILIAGQQGRIYNTITYPLTYNIAETIGDAISLLMLIIITIYTGEIVWRSREHKSFLIIDPTPFKNTTVFLANFTSIVIIQIILFAVFIGAGVLYQLSRGFTNIEISTYLKIIYGIGFTEIIMYTFICFLIHTLVKNKYTGHFIFIGFILIQPFLNRAGLNHHLLVFGSTPGIRYSDMSGLGPNLTGFVWLRVYWIIFTLIIACFTVYMSKRGYDELSIVQSLKKGIKKLINPLPLFLIVAFIFTGCCIYYNINIINRYVNPKQIEKARADFELNYKQYDGLPQPKITDINLSVDIYPESRDLFIMGNYELVNNESTPLHQIHLIVPTELSGYELEFSRPHILIEKNKTFGYHIYELAYPLLPGESINFAFNLELITRGFSHSENLSITKNGTFINSTILPSFGYNSRHEIDSPRVRRRYNLPEKERFREIDDPAGLRNNIISSDSDWISYEAVISTSINQIALTSGDLVNNWTENNRNYFHYKVDGQILNFFSFLSAEYTVHKDNWNDVTIEIYHHPGHDYNLTHMTNSIKSSLDYYTKVFGPYPHKIIRIAEFPRYGSFAQSFPTLIPFSEAIGFIAQVRENRVNYPFFVTAHEVAHQWWGHQLIGADVKGSMMLLEGLTQYSAMMVMKETFGENELSKQLLYEMTNYLSGRAGETRAENPLYLDSQQSYIHYHKAAVVLYGVADLLGEDLFNSVLKQFLNDRSYSLPPYPTSRDFLDYLYSAAPDSLYPFLRDSFEKITIFENRIIEAEVNENPDNTFTVKIETESHKFYSDGLGHLSPTDLNDWVDIVVFSEVFRGRRREIVPVYYQKHLITDKNNTFEIIVDRVPVEVGIDPFHKLVDNNPYLNRYKIR